MLWTWRQKRERQRVRRRRVEEILGWLFVPPMMIGLWWLSVQFYGYLFDADTSLLSVIANQPPVP